MRKFIKRIKETNAESNMSFFGDDSDEEELHLSGYLIGRTFQKIWRIGAVIHNESETKCHKGVDLRTGTEVVIKVESERTHVKALSKEIEIYQYFQQNDARFLRIPFLHDYGQEYKHLFAVFESKGTSISYIFSAFHEQLPIETVLYFGKQLLDLIERHHSNGYANGNICASKIIIGNTANTKSEGLVTSFLDFGKTEKLVESFNLLPEILPRSSKKDDVEATAELLISILPKANKKIWNVFLSKKMKSLNNRKKPSQRINRIKTMLANTETPIREVFSRFWNYCRSLGNDQTLDYSYLRNLLQDLSWKINGVRISKEAWYKAKCERDEIQKRKKPSVTIFERFISIPITLDIDPQEIEKSL